MKKRLSILLALMLVLGVMVTACGGGAAPAGAPTNTPEPAVEEATATPEEAMEEPTAEPETNGETETALVIWADDTRSPVLEAQSTAFEAEYGLKVEVQLVDFGDIREKFQISGPAGEGPDILVGAHDWIGELVASGLLAPIDLGDKEELFLESAIQGFTYDGALYGMPYALENVAFFRNTDLVPDAPATWTEVQEISAKLEEAGDVQLGYALQFNDAFHYYPIQTAFGGYVFGLNDDGSYNPDDVGIDSEGSIAAAQWLESMAEGGHLQADLDWDTAHAMFESGDAAMLITGPWALERMRDAGIPYAVSKLPGETQESQPFLGVQGFMVSAFSEDPILAQAFLTEFLATEEVMQAIFEADPRPPAFIPVFEKVDDPDLTAFAEAGENGLPMPAIPEMGAVWGSWGDAITLVFQQQQPADEAFQNAAEQIRTTIAEGNDE